MQKIKKTLSLLLILTMLMSVIGVMSVSAAGSATFTVTSSATAVNKTGTVTLDVTASGATKVACFKGRFEYDDTLLDLADIQEWVPGLLNEEDGQYVSLLGDTSFKVVSGAGTANCIVEYIYGPYVKGIYRADGILVKATFTASAAGAASIVFSAPDVSAGLLTDSALTIDQADLTFTGATGADKFITKSVTVNNDVAQLTALSAAPAVFNETFAAGTKAYTATVANSVTSVTIAATAGFNGTVTAAGLGEKALSVGANNIFNVVVTAQDGVTTETYTITITREDSGGSEEPMIESEEYLIFEYNNENYGAAFGGRVLGNIFPRTTIEEVIDELDITGDLTVYWASGDIVDPDEEYGEYATTGMKFVASIGDEEFDVTVVIIGDLTSAGLTEMTAPAIAYSIQSLRKASPYFTWYYFAAANYDMTGAIKLTDPAQIFRLRTNYAAYYPYFDLESLEENELLKPEE